MSLLTWWFPGEAVVWGQVFLFFALVNFIVGTFEFPRATVVTVILGVALTILAIYVFNQWFGVLPWLKNFFATLNTSATPTFYFFIFLCGVGILLGIWVQTRFDYWELTPNELIHHHGLLGDVERFSTAAMKFNKEISDIFEYMILRSATLLITLPTQPRPIHLENVLFVGYVMRRADEILEGGKVQREIHGASMKTDASGQAAVIQESGGGG
jgi:hypothetical protein